MRAAEMRAAEMRAAEMRAAEMRAAEMRGRRGTTTAVMASGITLCFPRTGLPLSTGRMPLSTGRMPLSTGYLIELTNWRRGILPGSILPGIDPILRFVRDFAMAIARREINP
jgi:hypothetical protein